MNQDTFCFGFTSETRPHGLKLLMKLEGHRAGNICVEHEAKQRNRKPPAYRWFAVQHVTWGIFHCRISTAPNGKILYAYTNGVFHVSFAPSSPLRLIFGAFVQKHLTAARQAEFPTVQATRCYRFQHPPISVTQIVLVKQNPKSLHAPDCVRVLQGSAMTLLSDEPQRNLRGAWSSRVPYYCNTEVIAASMDVGNQSKKSV